MPLLTSALFTQFWTTASVMPTAPDMRALSLSPSNFQSLCVSRKIHLLHLILMWAQLAAAIAANGPYSGAYVLLPAWKAMRVHDSEYTATYLLLAGTANPDFDPQPGILPPDVTNQIGVGLFVRTRQHLDI